MATVSGGWVMCSRSAARRKFSVSPRVTNWRTRRKSSMGSAGASPAPAGMVGSVMGAPSGWAMRTQYHFG
ncbi:Uncharacterised protein [Bordetella pertussis]|nr:Uncharacterised protein [Bordetella pertussis]